MSSLGLGSGMPGGSHHRDVLEASPTDAPSALRLIEELKGRGRVCVQGRNFPEAEALYGKGIEVSEGIMDGTIGGGPAGGDAAEARKKECAILRSNRSLARLQLGRLSEAKEDAEAATGLDPTYVKGYWRLGQACAALGDHGDAVRAYEAAIEADAKGDGKSTKALKREAEKARAKAEQERMLVEEGTAPSEPSEKKEKAKPKAPFPAPKSSTNKTGTKSSVVKDKSSDSAFTKSDHVRGYKIVNGKKTSYFHREQTEEEKRLIGDIAPKRVEDPAAVDATAAPTAEGASAWNKAGTWEERDLTSWASETLIASLSGVKREVPKSAKGLGG
eukprot:CAMPEP_0183294564 /NCGR_PEP_ID=MMETSP0160_2-20130417/2859_1 /TAXON_ID=2839 ORGANISM="Odontella Sinensis, Strain Grunow 1884" /NCGR_SAMPLE_ID=MMETSP0160_2 /ASSEMBLY_ACC=CAM_ASM_000250 /LENGTH=330 /DNA_ID=CAMNT_0025455913 /DNA_START=131 /DNA_END=1120 /DNA_ORIENTATION=+